MEEPIAHKDHKLIDHLQTTAKYCEGFATKLGIPYIGYVIGLLHDLGKASNEFQDYIKQNIEKEDSFDLDDNETIEIKNKIDHSTAGAQYIGRKKISNDLKSLMAVCIASHHSGLINYDSNTYDDTKDLNSRKDKDNCLAFNKEIKPKIKDMYSRFKIDEEKLNNEYKSLISKINKNKNKDFTKSIITQLLFSCLIDADRIDSATYNDDINKDSYLKKHNLKELSDKLEEYIKKFDKSSPINKTRAEISDRCFEESQSTPNIFSLTVPTGGGKTIASLRFGINHAIKNNMDRVIYIIPYTSIIDQNADVAIDIFGKDNVLEHHSSLTQKKNTFRNKINSENWNAPIVFTTMVQFFNALFDSGTRSARRAHQLLNSVIIFDEIQTLPIKLYLMFISTIQTLNKIGNSSIVLCTATQVPFDFDFSTKPNTSWYPKIKPIEIMNDVELFDKFDRVRFFIDIKRDWSIEDISKLAIEKTNIEKTNINGNCLVILNTKADARDVFKSCRDNVGADIEVIHLSTGMCQEHRRDKLSEIKKLLDSKSKLIVVSTQLIEAGVDVDFTTVIRALAGIDSIAQAAGRCNRNMKSSSFGEVHIIKRPDTEENISKLTHIKNGKNISLAMLTSQNKDILRKEEITKYFSNYLTKTYNYEVEYKIDDKTMYKSLGDFAFKFSHDNFYMIEKNTTSLIVQFDDCAKKLIDRLKYNDDNKLSVVSILMELQKYTINIYENNINKLNECAAIEDIRGYLLLSPAFYDDDFGVKYELDVEDLIC